MLPAFNSRADQSPNGEKVSIFIPKGSGTRIWGDQERQHSMSLRLGDIQNQRGHKDKSGGNGYVYYNTIGAPHERNSIGQMANHLLVCRDGGHSSTRRDFHCGRIGVPLQTNRVGGRISEGHA